MVSGFEILSVFRFLNFGDGDLLSCFNSSPKSVASSSNRISFCWTGSFFFPSVSGSSSVAWFAEIGPAPSNFSFYPPFCFKSVPVAADDSFPNSVPPGNELTPWFSCCKFSSNFGDVADIGNLLIFKCSRLLKGLYSEPSFLVVKPRWHCQYPLMNCFFVPTLSLLFGVASF